MPAVAAARAVALPFRDHVAQSCVTSPPYLQQRRYGDDSDELGQERSTSAYVAHLAEVLDEVRRVLRPDGLLWLNIGDKANGSGGAGGDWTREPRKHPTHGNRRLGSRRSPMQGPGKFLDSDYLDRSYLDVPGAVVRALLDRGWRLRIQIIWDKGRALPEDLRHAGRPRWSHEPIYMLAPGSRRPRFYPAGLAETGSVWHFPPGGDGDPHLAPFPDELARRCILASTAPGDLVIDPFHGSGTTGRVALAHGRRYAGSDLYATKITEPAHG